MLTKNTDEPDSSDEHVVEATLTADGDHTVLVVEDLAAHIAGRERRDMRERWSELLPT